MRWWNLKLFLVLKKERQNEDKEKFILHSPLEKKILWLKMYTWKFFYVLLT